MLIKSMYEKTNSPPRGSNSQPSDHCRAHTRLKSLTLWPIELGGPVMRLRRGDNESTTYVARFCRIAEGIDGR
jgi:hypothetical protein